MSIFNKIPIKRNPKSKFNLSHERKFSLNMGYLYPTLLQEVLPGDSFKLRTEHLMRFLPLVTPVMERINVHQFNFFVPMRLIWDEWEDFITGGKNGNLMPVHPYVTIGEGNKEVIDVGTLADYFGIPLIDQTLILSNSRVINALPFRAYQLIYNEYFRDQNLSDEVVFTRASGDSTTQINELAAMRRYAWEKDYFTSALPFAQRSITPVTVPTQINYNSSAVFEPNAGAGGPAGNLQVLGTGPQQLISNKSDASGSGVLRNIDSLSTQVNDLRKAVRLQEWLERNARGGARYIEQILAHWGVMSKDARLQRPEYLGGSKTPCIISETLSTYDNSAGGLPQGNMAGHGISVGNQNGFTRYFEEHGIIISLMAVTPRTSYAQGLARIWTRQDKFDYPWPEFAQLGEMEVKQKEVYMSWGDVNDADYNDVTFGYQSQYADWKYCQNTVHGQLRPNQPLDNWHQGRKFANGPVLNEQFVMSDPDPRIFAVTDPDEDKLICQFYNDLSVIRQLPYYNVPIL